MNYKVSIYKNGSLETYKYLSTYDGALSYAKLWLSDKYREYQLKVIIEERN